MFRNRIARDSIQSETRVQAEQLRAEQQSNLTIAFAIGAILLLIVAVSLVYAYRHQVRTRHVIQQSLDEKEMLVKEILSRIAKGNSDSCILYDTIVSLTPNDRAISCCFRPCSFFF